MNAWHGSNSTAVTPMDFKCSITAGTVKPKYLPRLVLGTAGCSCVKPLTCSS